MNYCNRCNSHKKPEQMSERKSICNACLKQINAAKALEHDINKKLAKQVHKEVAIADASKRAKKIIEAKQLRVRRRVEYMLDEIHRQNENKEVWA